MERELRRTALRNPLDPEPVTQLGLHALAEGRLEDAGRCLRDALRLKPRHPGALLGRLLLEYVRDGRVPDEGLLSMDELKGGESLPVKLRGIVMRLSRQGAAAAMEGSKRAPGWMPEVPMVDLAARRRAGELRDQRSPMLVGRERLVQELLNRIHEAGERSLALVHAPGIDIAMLWDGLLPALGSGDGIHLWEAQGPLAHAVSSIGLQAVTDRLRAARARGEVVVYRRVHDALNDLSPAQWEPILRTGALLTALPRKTMGQLVTEVPSLSALLDEVPVKALGSTDTRRALAATWQQRGEGEDDPRAHAALNQAVRLSRGLLTGGRLPEAAVRLLEEASGSSHASGELTVEQVRAASARLTGLPMTSPLLRRSPDARALASRLEQGAPGCAGACRVLADLMVPALWGASEERSPGGGGFALGLLVAGRAAGRNLALLGHTARLLLGRGRQLSLEPAELAAQLDLGTLAPRPGSELAEHLEHPGPGMVLLRGVQRAAPEVWQAVEPMLCGGDRRLQRQILALEAEHRTGAESVGFLSRQGAGSLEDLVRREVLGEARLLSERVEVVLLTEAEGTEVLL